MSKKIFFALILAVLFVLPVASLAQWEWVPFGAGDAASWFFGPDIPAEFTKDAYSILQWLIFPFLSLWVIIYGILSQLRIFRRKTWINGVLALLIAAMAGPTGGLVYAVRILFVSYGIFGFGAFVVLLFVGTALWFLSTMHVRWGIGSGKGWGKSLKKFEQEQKLQTQIVNIRSELRALPEGAVDRRTELTKEFIRLNKELKRERTET